MPTVDTPDSAQATAVQAAFTELLQPTTPEQRRRALQSQLTAERDGGVGSHNGSVSDDGDDGDEPLAMAPSHRPLDPRLVDSRRAAIAMRAK